MVQAIRSLGFFLRARQRGQEHSGEDRDDTDDNEQFDQRKAVARRRGGVLIERPGFRDAGLQVTLTDEGVAPGVIRMDGVGVGFHEDTSLRDQLLMNLLFDAARFRG